MPPRDTRVRLDIAVDFPADLDTASKAVSDFAGTASLAIHGALAIPAAFHDKPAPVDVRRQAYLRFQDAMCRSASLANYLADFTRVLRRPILLGGPWDPASRAHVALRDANEALGELLAAMAHVRLVGGPGPVDAMRAAANSTGDVFAELPTAFWRNRRAVQLEAFTKRQQEVGDTLIAFTEACRLDLAYTRARRRRIWQIWRPKTPSPSQQVLPAIAPDSSLVDSKPRAKTAEKSN